MSDNLQPTELTNDQKLNTFEFIEKVMNLLPNETINEVTNGFNNKDVDLNEFFDTMIKKFKLLFESIIDNDPVLKNGIKNSDPRDFKCWNDTSVAHSFIRLMTKRNHPFNETPLSLEKFNEEYAILKDYIEWRGDKGSSSADDYNFTYDSMTNFINMIDYNTNNEAELSKIWTETIFRSPQK